MGRLFGFLYGAAVYVLFFGTFAYAMAFVSGVFVPKTIDTGETGSILPAVGIDLALMTLFALQHSIMARPQFKAWWTRYVPPALERSTYVLAATLLLALLMWQWRPLPAVVWQVNDTAAVIALYALGAFGWVVLLTSTFLINHFELFGLHQVFNNLTGRSMPNAKFRTPFLYKLVRHPLYLGFIIAFWATPVMTVGHLLFAAVTTAYIFVGILLEERDLIDVFGDEYRRYRHRVGMIAPWPKRSRPENRLTPAEKRMV